MSNKTIKLSEIKKLDVEEGDTLVVRASGIDQEVMAQIGNLLECNVIRVEDFDDLGLLKFKQNEQ